jgi:acid phosphatase family membrane protein YuiD
MAGSRAFFAVLVSWLTAQAIKFLIAKVKNGGFFYGRAMKTGGMPSAHSALVASLAFCAGVSHGTTSVEFLTAMVLAVIVCYDALGMRTEFHRQSKLLRDLAVIQFGEAQVNAKYPGLNDYQGHELAEVVAGLVLGLIISAAFLNL